jgi:acetyltransferase-like isoleucine patch superfamily enzyme
MPYVPIRAGFSPLMPNWRRLPWRLSHVDGPRRLSQLRRLCVLATHRHARVPIAPSAWLGPRFTLFIPDHGTLTIGEHVQFRRGFTCEISGNGRVSIGDRTVFTSDALIQCSTSVDIGPDCSFGQSLLIVDGDHRFRNPDLPMLAQGFDFRPVTIGAGTAITTKCSVIGANVGERVFVGANSVITKDIPSYCLAIGAPAKVVDYYGPPGLRPAGIDP